MKTTQDFKRFLSELMLGIYIVTSANPVPAIADNSSDKIIYPLKKVAKLECRFSEFSELTSDCIQDLPILNTKDYQKYSTLNGGYNDYTRIYTMLWGSSYKYGWDIGNGGHIGTDIATSKGTPVYSMANGKVLKAKNDVALGNFISIQHTIKGKTVVSNYAHLSKLEVSAGDSVDVGDKIGEVGSTGNSTGNHLHFQIDLNTSEHPYYYDYNKCPYSYYNITENGLCIDELSKNTIDPLLFLETSGAVLDDISTTSTTTTTTNNNNSTNSNTNSSSNSNTSSNDDLSIFDRTVYVGYSTSDIKKVQEIFQKIGAYKGSISGDYNDIEDSILAYQLSNNIISSKSDDGAGRFGPKTRIQAKKDYLEYLDNGSTVKTYEVINTTNIKTQKIERENLMSREEIEKKEVEDFLKHYNIELNFINQGGNIQKGNQETLKLSITDKKGKAFKGEMPGGMTFIVNTEMVSVFPERLYYFTDGKRDIIITGISEGNTNLYVKIGEETIKTIPLKVYSSGKTIYPETGKIISPAKITLGELQSGIVAFKDSNGKYLINLKYGSNYNIKASGENKICIKKGDVKNIKKIYSTNSCGDDEFKNSIDFTYDQTVGGLLVFDYKATSKDFNITITNKYSNTTLSEKKLVVSDPKGLTNTYAYKKEILEMLTAGVVDGINKGYFLEDRSLTQRDAFNWIENALYKMKSESYDSDSKKIIDANIVKIEKQIPYSSRTKNITRQEFLELTYSYLIFDDTSTGSVSYRDIDTATSEKLANVFDENTTWKDQFGEKYFRPEAKITRGEGAYFMAIALEKIAKTYLTLK